MKLAVTALAALLLSALSAGAAEKPVVGVAFELAESDYRDEFTADELATIEAVAAERFAALLAGKLGFARFVTDVPADGEYRLVVTLDRREKDAVGIAVEVGFHIRLEGPGLGELEPVYWIFRGRERWREGLPVTLPFLAEIEHSMTLRDHFGLADQLLKNVPLTADSELLTAEVPRPGWVLPFTRRDLCLDLNTRFQFVHEVRTTLMTRQTRYEGVATGTLNPGLEGGPRVFCEVTAGTSGATGDPDRQTAALDELKTTPPENLRLLAVYVQDYRRAESLCSDQDDPENVSFGGGGQ